VDCSRAIHAQVLKKVVILLKIVAVFEPSENSCRSTEKSSHFSGEKKMVCPHTHTTRQRQGPQEGDGGGGESDSYDFVPSHTPYTLYYFYISYII
jgi:hypothetical protein